MKIKKTKASVSPVFFTEWFKSEEGGNGESEGEERGSECRESVEAGD